jgi:protein-disulfide isomerase
LALDHWENWIKGMSMSRRVKEEAKIRAVAMEKKKMQNRIVASLIGVVALVAIGFGYNSYVSQPLAGEGTVTWDVAKIYPTDIVFGQAKAPVRITEYGSLTCIHCSRFHTQELESFVKNYVDTGKVQMVFRHFPYDRAGLEGATAVSCLPREERGEAMMTLMAGQSSWVSAEKPGEAALSMFDISSDEKMKAALCLNDGKMQKTVADIGLEATSRGISSTPTFVVGTQLFNGFVSASALGNVVEAQIAKK